MKGNTNATGGGSGGDFEPYTGNWLDLFELVPSIGYVLKEDIVIMAMKNDSI